MPYMLDASAVLAVLLEEPGADVIADMLADCRLSTVNLSETVNAFVRRGASAADAIEAIEVLGIEMVAFDVDMAVQAVAMQPLTAAAGLSLGDRACLALARKLELPAATADRAWLKVEEGVGVEIMLIR